MRITPDIYCFERNLFEINHCKKSGFKYEGLIEYDANNQNKLFHNCGSKMIKRLKL